MNEEESTEEVFYDKWFGIFMDFHAVFAESLNATKRLPTEFEEDEEISAFSFVDGNRFELVGNNDCFHEEWLGSVFFDEKTGQWEIECLHHK